MPHALVRRWLVACLLSSFGLAAAAARANDSAIIAAVYGEGMKAFYAGRYAQAHETFSQAIEAGSTDPRCYYFRGLSNLRLGRAPDAALDYAKGAEIEAKDFDVFYNVSGALARVQGPERLMLERYRAAGRKTALAEIEKIRFEYFRRFQSQDAVTGAATTASGEAAPPAAMPPADAPAAPAAADPSNPFGTPAPATPVPATPAPAANPFGM